MMSFELEAIFTDTVFADDGMEICTTLVAFPLRFVCCNGRDSSDATVSDICVLLLTYVMVRDNVDALLAKSDCINDDEADERALSNDSRYWDMGTLAFHGG